jgi:hypothetical protein
MGLKRQRCPVLPVRLSSLATFDTTLRMRDYQAAARTTYSAAELNRRPRYKRVVLALWLMTALGRKQAPTAPKRHFWSPPNNGHHQTSPAGPFGADFVAEVG